MEELWDSVQNIRFANKNLEGRYFIPEAALVEVISKPAVELALRNLGVPVHEIRDLTAGILEGARKCFAILILIRRGEAISSFFRHDSLQESHPDNGLPYTSEALKQIFDGGATDVTLKSFDEHQWEFAIPIMQRHRIFRKLNTHVVLPFLQEEQVGQGSMGTVWKIELHPQCHRLPIESHKVIRKQIEYRQGEDVAVFEKELRNLSILTYLEHPNIVQLYCSYIYRQRCNLIFAVADGGSLKDFLDGNQDTKWPEGSQLLLALTGLADAINAMHNFTSDAFDLSLSGCHHDLAPRNILIHGEAFLLADFGLSTFRNAEEDSLTTFKEVRGSYIAPECQTFRDGHVKTEKIGRASDIWSFGCILAEVLTHMVLGPAGVEEFRKERKVQVTPEIEWYRFHRGPETPSPEVALWLDRLQANGEPYRVRMIGLIRKMLLMDPNGRPRSAQVLKVLRGISILSIANSVSLGLDSVYNAHRSIDIMLGNMRFQSWLFAFNRLFDEIDRTELSELNFDFDKIVQALKEMHRTLEESEEVSTGAKHPQQSLLRYQHARLIEALPPSFRSVAYEHLVKQVLHNDDTEELGGLSTAITEAGEEDIGVLVAVKRLTALAETGGLTEQKALVLDRKDIIPKEEIDIHDLALQESTSEYVLVERLRYKEPWADERIGTELRRRLTSVVGLLNAKSTAQIPGTLHCKGIFHDPSDRSFGVVYGLPPSRTRAITLHGLLANSSHRPLLEYRFRLAFDICQCIYTFHKVGWLHRNLHSMNVLFFPPEKAENAKWAKTPRIFGFAGSRENRLDSFTHGPDVDRQLRNYQHPEYLTHRERYREEFDYYSVGMLLLEIGLWSTLSKITDSDRFKNISDEQFRREVIATKVSKLGIAMGTRYMEVTRTCLEGGITGKSGGSGDRSDALYMSFKSLVVDQIPLIEQDDESGQETNI